MQVIDPTSGALAASLGIVQAKSFDVSSDALVMFSNSKPNAPELLHGMRARLGALYGRDDIGYVKKDSAGLPAPKSLIEDVASKYRVAVIALGDCGSCSSYCFQDALELEKRGLVAYVVTTPVFQMLVQAHARAAGVKARLIVLDHPIAGLKPEALQSRIDQACELLIRDSELVAA